MKSIFFMLIILLLVSCSQSPVIQTIEVTRIVPQTVVVTHNVEIIITATPLPPTSTPIPSPTVAATPTPTFIIWSPSQVVDAFLEAGLEAEDTKPLTKDDYGLAPMLDIDNLHFYIPSLCSDCGGRIFSFSNLEDLAKVKEYYDSLSEVSALFFSWVFVKDNILVQINGDLNEETARQYETALNNMK